MTPNVPNIFFAFIVIVPPFGRVIIALSIIGFQFTLSILKQLESCIDTVKRMKQFKNTIWAINYFVRLMQKYLQMRRNALGLGLGLGLGTNYTASFAIYSRGIYQWKNLSLLV